MRKLEFKSKEVHLNQVRQLQRALQQKNRQFSLKKSASKTLRNGDYKKNVEKLDFSAFCEILEFSPKEKWILVEPRMTFAELCQFTLAHELVPLVVPEFKTITVGGAIMGGALESSSHKYGQFNDTCLEYECLLGNGELIYASATQHEDLFYGCAGSYGTLALLTAVKIQLRTTKKWIQLHYVKEDAQKAVDTLIRPLETDFAEAIVYHPHHAVVITGDISGKPTSKKVFRQNHSWSPWYVQHVLQTRHTEEYMTHYEYLFRLDRGGFWIGRYVHSLSTMIRLLLHLGIPKVREQGDFRLSFFFRFCLGWAFSSQSLYQFWHRIPNDISKKLFFIHDFYTPANRALEVLAYFMEQTGIFPIWLCPIAPTKKPQFLSSHFGNTSFLNIGLYGIPKSPLSIPELSARLEKKILDFGGRKMLYSYIYYDQETFAKVYSEEKYEGLRKKYFADPVFPTLFQKVTTKNF